MTTNFIHFSDWNLIYLNINFFYPWFNLLPLQLFSHSCINSDITFSSINTSFFLEKKSYMSQWIIANQVKILEHKLHKLLLNQRFFRFYGSEAREITLHSTKKNQQKNRSEQWERWLARHSRLDYYNININFTLS